MGGFSGIIRARSWLGDALKIYLSVRWHCQFGSQWLMLTIAVNSVLVSHLAQGLPWTASHYMMQNIALHFQTLIPND